MLTLAYSRDFAPFAEETPDGARGLAIDRIRQALTDAGSEVSFMPMDLQDLIPALIGGKADGIAATGAAPDRRDIMAFSDPLLQTGGAWFVLNRSKWPADRVLEQPAMNPPRAVTPENGPLLSLMRQRFKGLKVDGVTDYAEALNEIVSGRAAAAGLNKQVGEMMAARDHPEKFALPARLFHEIALVLAVPAGDPKGILKPFNAALARIPS